MATIADYDPCLTYAQIESKGSKEKVKLEYSNGSQKNRIANKAVVTMQTGNTVEEMLHTLRQFESATNHWKMDDEDTIIQFRKCLDMVADDRWECMVDDWEDKNDKTLETWKEAKTAWIKSWIPDHYAKQTILSAWTNGKYTKPSDVSVEDHSRRIRMLTIYMDMLPDQTQTPFTAIEKKNLEEILQTYRKTASG